MDETRENRLAAILARGLIRVRQRAARTGQWRMPGNDSQPTVSDASAGDQPAADHSVAGREQGEQ